MTGLTLGRVFGTEVRVHWTWIFVLAFIAVVFGIDLSDGTAAMWPTALAWGSSIAVAALVLASVTAHELAHVKVARRNGGQVPVVVVQLLGGPYIMEVKPRTAGEEFRIAIAGSALSLIVAVVGAAVAAALSYGPVNIDQAPASVQAVQFVAVMVAVFNLLLCLVNLVPGYPLDGARALHSLVWRRTGKEGVATSVTIRVGRYVGLLLIGTAAMTLAFMDFIVGLSLFVAGWLMIGSSRLMDKRSLLQGLVAGLHVSDAEDADPARVPPQLTLDVFAGEYLADRLGAAALVERGTELLGLIGTAQIRRIPRRIWPRTRTEEAMVKIGDVPRMDGDTDLWAGLEALERTGLDALVVAAAGPGTLLMTRRSAARVVHERAEERQRELMAMALVRRGRFRGR
ncbi:MAG: site-2 protease family protein [Candidatus Limnocylindrales bacterium]